MLQLRTARPEEFPEILEMLNVIFFTEDTPEAKRDFLRLLPKLYKAQYKPWDNNYCAFEDAKPVAATGMYVYEMEIAGQALRYGGIGNVGVPVEYRKKGYMKMTMDLAMQAMKDRGCDIAQLGGNRHRYRYWGFDQGGAVYNAEINRINLYHVFGRNELAPGWSARAVEPTDTKALRQIQSFVESSPIHLKHDSEAFYDILCSWREWPWAIWHEDRLAGFFTLSNTGKEAYQLQLCDWVEDLEMPLRAVFSALPEQTDSIGLTIPLWRGDLLAKAEFLAEGISLDCTGQFCVLNWENTLRALLKLQTQCKTLLDGQFTVLIRGYNGDELLSISVKNGQPCVEKFTGIPDKELDHLEATSYFLNPVSATRTCPVAQNWFPLPLKFYSIDTV